MNYQCGQICVCTNKARRKKRSWHAEEKRLVPSRIQVFAGEVKKVMGKDLVERVIELIHNCVLNEQGRRKKPSGQVKYEILRNICWFFYRS